jgi:hypothetical protein
VKNIYQKLLFVYLLLVIGYWIVLHLSHKTDSSYNFVYSLLFSLIPLIGGLVGVIKSKIWGRFKSHLGKAVLSISTGLFLWGAGSMIWSYYNLVAKVAIPYPSLADIGFAASIVFWAIGAVYLSKASGAGFAFRRSALAKVFTFVVPAAVLAISYYLLVSVGRQGVLVPQGETALKVFLDIAYPFGDVISLTLATVIFGLSFKYFGGVFKRSIILILLGLAIMYFGDFIFSYTTTVGTFYNGDWGDLVLTLGLAAMTLGVLGFAAKPAIKEAVKPEGATA